MMELHDLIAAVKRRPDFHKVGMILCHNGVVRGTSRDGKPVSSITVRVDRDRLEQLVEEMKSRPGIVDVQVHIREGNLKVGEDVMYVVVAGDFREHCFRALMDTVEVVKAGVTHKTEHP